MDKNLPHLRFDNKTVYPARLGLILGVSGCLGTPAAHLPRARKILTDKHGGTLRIGPFTKRLSQYWTGAFAKAVESAPQPDYAFSYECDADWGDHLIWHIHPMGHARLAMYAMQLAGPFCGQADYVCYAKLDTRPEVFYWRETESRFTPGMYSSWGQWKHIQDRTDIDEVISICRAVFSALGIDHVQKYTRAEHENKHLVRGTRLESAIEYYSQSMTHTFMQDTAIRIHIALENLFWARPLNQSSTTILASALLADVLKPAETRNLCKNIYRWRNKYVHGTFPPYQFGPGTTHTKALLMATKNGMLLVSSLIKKILRTPELLAIFNSPLMEDEFIEQVCDYVVPSRIAKHVNWRRRLQELKNVTSSGTSLSSSQFQEPS